MEKALHAARLACCYGIAALLCACAGGTPFAAYPSAQRDGSAREARAASRLLYAGWKRAIEIFAYPSGTYQGTAKTAGLISAMCSDTKGDVFVTATAKSAGVYTGYVYEYAPGGTSPIATLDAPRHFLPVSCAGDPTTGDLAVTTYNIRTFTPSIAIYARGSGSPKVYFTRYIGANPQPAYDANGDLFVTSGGNEGALLAPGKQSFVKVTLDQTMGGAEHLQWDGRYFALQSFAPSKHQGEKLFERVYRFQLSGRSGTLVGTSQFDDWPEKDAGQSWIAGGTIVATPYAHIVFWNYPAGRKPIKIVRPPQPCKAITVSIVR